MMNLDDLQYIFKQQLDQTKDSNVKLFFMLIDGDHKVVERHPANDLESLLPMLDSFQYSGCDGNIPRFAK